MCAGSRDNSERLNVNNRWLSAWPHEFVTKSTHSSSSKLRSSLLLYVQRTTGHCLKFQVLVFINESRRWPTNVEHSAADTHEDDSVVKHVLRLCKALLKCNLYTSLSQLLVSHMSILKHLDVAVAKDMFGTSYGAITAFCGET